MTENKPGLLDQVRPVIQIKHYSLRKSTTFLKSWAFDSVC